MVATRPQGIAREAKGAAEQGECGRRWDDGGRAGAVFARPLASATAIRSNLLRGQLRVSSGTPGARCRVQGAAVRAERPTLVGLYAKLKLQVNGEKSAVARAWDRQFLGFSFWVAPGRVIKRRVAPKALSKMKQRIREITSRIGGRSIGHVVTLLRSYLVGWRAYFRLADTPQVFALASTHRTAGCGPACPVVWEGSRRATLQCGLSPVPSWRCPGRMRLPFGTAKSRSSPRCH
jgi:hypothetical protein